jgi:hypothetical protein
VTCSLCDREHVARGFCDLHYRRWRRYGTPHKPPRPSLAERLAARSYADDAGCLVIKGCPNQWGYQCIRDNGRQRLAHRVAYELAHGPGSLIDGMEIDHLCRNPACVKPEHLEQVTPRQNILRARRATVRTHCRRGHLLTAETTWITPQGYRGCRPCNVIRQRAVRERKRLQRYAASTAAERARDAHRRLGLGNRL